MGGEECPAATLLPLPLPVDPRITVAWCKKVDLNLEKVFPTTLRDKFPWAMVVPSTFRF